MKKTLIALALTALPVAAMADVTLYGQIKGGLNVENNTVKVDGVKTEKQYGQKTNTAVRDYGSRIGFKGEEDLGNGLKTIWQVEQSVSLGGNTSTGWSNRETFIGLEGDFGKIRVGNLKNVFDEHIQETDAWEYDAAATPALGLGILTRMDGRIGASIKYDTPEIAGFTGSLHYKTSSNSAADDDFRKNNSGKGSDELYAGLGYENSGFFANYGFGLYNKATVNKEGKAKNAQVHRLEGGYDADNLFVSAVYQYADGYDSTTSYVGEALNLTKVIKDATGKESTVSLVNFGDASGAGLKRQEAAVTVAYTFGAITPRITYAHGFDAKVKGGEKVKNTKYDQVIIGADYALSKRTTALVSAGWLSHGLGHGTDTAGNDVKNKYTQKAASIGLKHKF